MTAQWLSNHRQNDRNVQRIQLPMNWTPRWYQVRLFQQLDAGIKRAVCVWHRRAGKDVAMINFAAMQSQKRVATYWHVFPTQKQARKAIWEGITSSGQRIIDQAFPKELVKRTRDDEMMVEFKNGAIWRLVGGDNYDSLVGSNVAGCVFSEYAITDPASWDYVRPILVESGGWSAFISTPRGRNHYYEMYQMALKDPAWFAELLTVEDTGFISLADIEAERRAGMSDEQIAQEFYCDFSAKNYGDIFAKEILQAQATGRIGDVPHDARYPVETAWDMGRDTTSIWFAQRIGQKINLIDHYHNRNKNLDHYTRLVNSKPYAYNRHIAPHDGDRTWYGTGQTIGDIARNHGIHFTYAPKLSRDNGIEAARAMMSRCYWDETLCDYGLKALRQYHYKWDDEKKVLSREPVHDWSSHPSDSFRYLAVTPEFQGLLAPHGLIGAMGHNGGPPLEGAGGGYDPLGTFRTK